MSRFWGGGSDSSSGEEDDIFEETESEEESGSEEEEEKGKNFFDIMSSDEEEEETKRVVRSQKDKRNEAINASITKIKTALTGDDWPLIQEEIEVLVKAVQKAMSAMDRPKVPRSFVRCMVHLEDALEETRMTKDKKLTAIHQKAMNATRQKLRKHKTVYQKEIESFRQSPVDTDQSEEERENAPEGEEEEAEAEEERPLTAEDVDKVIGEVISSRGKKNVNRKKQLETLRTLLALEEVPAHDRVKLLLAIVTLRIDQSIGMTTYMPIPAWKSSLADFTSAIELLEQNDKVVVTTDVDLTTDEESEQYKRYADRGLTPIPGSLVAILERLDDEFTKSLQNIDSHTTDYIERLRDASDLYLATVRLQLYYEGNPATDRNTFCRTIMKRVEQIYYKTEVINNASEAKVMEKLKGTPEKVDSAALMHRLCSYLYKSGDDREKIRALLCEVYHHALQDRYFKARDMLLMSHLQESIHNADIPAKILFNRAMVQIGLCAFRHGMLKEAQAALNDIISTGRAKELLAQGIISQRGVEKSSEQEKLEKQRQVPFHMHINLELIECIFLASSMILEVPFMAAGSYEARKRVLSKALRRVLDMRERQIFFGPPENTREHIMHATKALMGGDWEEAIRLVNSIKVWDLMPRAEEIKKMLYSKIQRSGIQAYLLSFGNFYETISLEQLAKMFKMEKAEVHAIVSGMIVGEDLHASLDQVTDAAVIHRVEPTKLQYLSLQYTDKVQSLIDVNEKILEVRTGNLGDHRQGPAPPGGRFGNKQPQGMTQNKFVGGYRNTPRRFPNPSFRPNYFNYQREQRPPQEPRE